MPVSKVAHLASELLRHRPALAPSIAAKALLARGMYGIDVTRFLMVGLYAHDMKSWADSMGYLPELEPGLRTLNWQGDSKRLTVDKLAMTERLSVGGLPTPRLLGVIGRDERAHPHQGLFPSLRTLDELASVLASAPDRLFVKPATGWRGDGICGPERREGCWWLDGLSCSDRELAQRLLSTAPPSGLLLQERIGSHRALAPIGGELGLGCVRINTALTSDGPEVFFIFGKIMGSSGLVDNFAGGKFGNMLARIDQTTGRIERVFGRQRDQRYLMESVTHHPLTGAPLIGFQLPLWDQAVALALRAAIAFHEAPLIGADIAFTDDGPLIIEMQSDWDSNVPQLIMEKGLRPMLREIVPRLATSQDVRNEALEQMGLTADGQRRRRAVRQPRA